MILFLLILLCLFTAGVFSSRPRHRNRTDIFGSSSHARKFNIENELDELEEMDMLDDMDEDTGEFTRDELDDWYLGNHREGDDDDWYLGNHREGEDDYDDWYLK